MLGAAIRAILVADVDANTALSGRVYPQMKDENETSQPYAVYNVIDDGPESSLSGHSGLSRARVQIDVFDDHYADAHDAAEKVRLALLDYVGTSASVDICWCLPESLRDDIGNYQDGRETKIHRVSRDFIFWFAQADGS